MITKAYVQIADGQVHYRTTPGDSRAAPIVFLHQTASSGRMWEKVMAAIAGCHCCYALDTPGFGGSFDPPGSPVMADYVGWLFGALDAIGLGGVHLVGHHTGAAIALEAAARAPARILSLAMIGPSPITLAERETLARQFGRAFRPGRSGAYLLQNWEYLRVGGADAEMALLHAEMQDMLRAWSARPHAYAAVWTQDFAALYAALSCPTMIMSAPDDILWPWFEHASALRPDFDAVVLSGGANFAPDLIPNEVATALLRHITTI